MIRTFRFAFCRHHFCEKPYEPNWKSICADAVIIGAPFDSGTQYRSGARFGLEACVKLLRFFHLGTQVLMITRMIHLFRRGCTGIDIGDADIIHAIPKKS